MIIPFILNGKERKIDSPPQAYVAGILAGLKLDRFVTGCGKGQCGTCLILLDDEPAYACTLPALRIKKRKITTLEGILKDPLYKIIEENMTDQEIFLCPYCHSARILSIYALITGKKGITEESIFFTLKSVECLCTGYTQLYTATLNSIESHRRSEN